MRAAQNGRFALFLGIGGLMACCAGIDCCPQSKRTQGYRSLFDSQIQAKYVLFFLSEGAGSEQEATRTSWTLQRRAGARAVDGPKMGVALLEPLTQSQPQS